MVTIIAVIGGIGFFLLGMNLITDGLKSIAGDTLRIWLNRFTGGPISAIATGTIITLLVQSSTATTLMTIGFVSAGMLSFLQAVGVIFGANLGTTSIGWIVSFFGLKFSISEFALPLIGIGMLLKQFSKEKFAHTGVVFTGFGLLFVGIQFLQEGMSDLSKTIDPAKYAGDTFFSMLLLVFIGIVMTIIMQSSSAAVATTITVLASGVIHLEQAVLLVIGQNIGTTLTAAIAAIGASTPAKRTALSHILFNVGTGFITLACLPVIMKGLNSLSQIMSLDDPALLLALFHTFFSLFGIMIFTPFIRQFTNMIAWMLPEKKSSITQYLDDSVIEIPSVAIETATRALKEATKLTLTTMAEKLNALTLRNSKNLSLQSIDEKLMYIQQETEEIRNFVEEIEETSSKTKTQYISILHALDHIDRMIRLTLSAKVDRPLINRDDEVYPVIIQLLENIDHCLLALEEDQIETILENLSVFAEELSVFRKQERANIFHVTAKGEITVSDAFHYVQLILFVDDLAYHIWRTFHHLHISSNEPIKEKDAQ